MTISRKKAVENGENPRSNLAQVLCIRYPINFETKSVSALFDSGSEVNTIYLTFAKVRSTNVGAQKIDNITLDTYEIVIVVFLIKDKANQIKFFEKTFLVADVSPKIVF